jgi:hypothetical protein
MVAGLAAGAQALGIGLAMEVVGGCGLGFFLIPLILILVAGVAFVLHGILRLVFRGPKQVGALPGVQELLGKIIARAGGYLLEVSGPTRSKMRWLRLVASISALLEPLRALDRALAGIFRPRRPQGPWNTGWGPRPS